MTKHHANNLHGINDCPHAYGSTNQECTCGAEEQPMKFEIELKHNEKNKAFYDKCVAAMKMGTPVTYKRAKHLVYHCRVVGKSGEKSRYVVGLVKDA